MFFKWTHIDVLIQKMEFSKCIAAFFTLVPLACSLARGEPLKPFLTNYCTAFPTGPKSNPDQWKHCCVEHDLYFWAGGCRGFRLAADKKLRDCVASTGAREIAYLMYLGVRIGSYSPFKIKEERWGNGWVDGRGELQALKPEDLSMIQWELQNRPSHEISPDMLSRFIETLDSQIKEFPTCSLPRKSL
jgi:hypothetical protein